MDEIGICKDCGHYFVCKHADNETITCTLFVNRETCKDVVHGRWIFGTANHREYMKCSVCLKSQTPTGVFTYCPNCGADMRGGNEDA